MKALLVLLFAASLSCTSQPAGLRYTIEDRQEIHELNHRLIYRLITDVEPKGQQAIDQMMAVFRDLEDSQFDALFVYFYLDEYRGTSETLWGSVTQAPDRTSEIMAALNPFEKLPDGSSMRMSGGFAEYDADGNLLRTK